MRQRLLIACPGVGHIRRGFETFSEELAAAITPITVGSVKLAGIRGCNGYIPLPKRYGYLARYLGALLLRDGYFVEQIAFAISLLPTLLLPNRTIVFSGDGTVLNILWRIRCILSPVKNPSYHLVLSNSAPFSAPYCWCDYIHHTTKDDLDIALARGGRSDRHTFIPMGFTFPSSVSTRSEYLGARQALKLPTGSSVILSVGAIGNTHKRHNYLVEEVAALADLKVDAFLVIVGQVEEGFAEFKAAAQRTLGERVRIVENLSSLELKQYYQASDVFVLCSIDEGFGRAIVEALGEGLGVVIHDSKKMRTSFNDLAQFIDMERKRSLTEYLQNHLHQRFFGGEEIDYRIRLLATERFDWSVVGTRYSEMFEHVSTLPMIANRLQFAEMISPHLRSDGGG